MLIGFHVESPLIIVICCRRFSRISVSNNVWCCMYGV